MRVGAVSTRRHRRGPRAPTHCQRPAAGVGLHFGNPLARALEAALCQFAVGALAPEGFRACDLRTVMPELCGAAAYSSAQASYDLRRLCRKGFLERIPHTHRYRLTAWGRGPRWHSSSYRTASYRPRARP